MPNRKSVLTLQPKVDAQIRKVAKTYQLRDEPVHFDHHGSASRICSKPTKESLPQSSAKILFDSDSLM